MAKTKVAESSRPAKDAAKVLKNFKTNSDVEAFYRFVYEGDLRIEAGKLLRLRSGIDLKTKTKTKRTRKKKAKTLQ